MQLIGSDARIPRPDFIESDYSSLKAPYENGVIICNPPYGERLGDAAQAEELYRGMGSLFTDFPGWGLGVITNQKNFTRCIGRNASLQKSLKAGNLDTVFYIFKGSSENKVGSENKFSSENKGGSENSEALQSKDGR